MENVLKYPKRSWYLNLANYYEEQFDALVEGLSTVIEPIMIVFVGGMIGVMVVALYLPIFSAGDLAGG